MGDMEHLGHLAILTSAKYCWFELNCHRVSIKRKAKICIGCEGGGAVQFCPDDIINAAGLRRDVADLGPEQS